jgi:hypothetical protein
MSPICVKKLVSRVYQMMCHSRCIYLFRFLYTIHSASSISTLISMFSSACLSSGLATSQSINRPTWPKRLHWNSEI